MDDKNPNKRVKLNEEPSSQLSIPIKIDNVLNKILLHPCETLNDFIENKVASYAPYYAHHFFHNEEVALLDGYNTLIHIYFSCNWFDVYVEIDLTPMKSKSKEHIELSEEDKNYYIENIIKHLKTIPLEGGFCSKEEFMERLKIPLLWVPGMSAGIFKAELGAEGLEEVDLRKIDLSETENLTSCLNKESNNSKPHPDVKNFQILHRRIEWFLHWYIESASSIDQEDRWAVWLPIIKREQSLIILGLITTYLFFSIPKSRIRISQVLIFPQYQGNGLGFSFLDIIYSFAIKDENIMEITVEDPALSMMQLRDILTIEILLRNHVIKKDSLKPLKTDELLKILQNPNGSVNILKDVAMTCFPSQTWEEVKEKIHKYTKESPRQIARLLVLISFFRYLPNPLPKIESNIEDEIRGFRVRKDPDQEIQINEKNGDRSNIDKLFRVAVKKRLLADNSDTLFGSSQSEMVQNLEIAWNQVYSSFYATVKKIRTTYIS
ncbi:Histone acetyl transferase HAT1 N-terminus family protein [Cryptosporidium meleagridis]|uniref:histone acetyltransferase n=1 Tax=Cryptosporidium meleagridis TaxID=93969 RepID=A0A2P4Z2C8_9CRYT|nr:Histone acetyl transferase HAT1 N-terminus family protein [Cryptosporidium meleagridis]